MVFHDQQGHNHHFFLTVSIKYQFMTAKKDYVPCSPPAVGILLIISCTAMYCKCKLWCEFLSFKHFKSI